jgi:hypothetical protein
MVKEIDTEILADLRVLSPRNTKEWFLVCRLSVCLSVCMYVLVCMHVFMDIYMHVWMDVLVSSA